MTRLTYNPAVNEVAWQRQIRDSRQNEWSPSVSLKLKHSVVKRITKAQAEVIILKYEWLGTMPLGVTDCFGLFFGPHCAGVTCFCVGGGGAGVAVSKEWGLKQSELAYLARGANTHWSPNGANSRLVNVSLRLLAKDDPNIKLAIAYSDTDAGEIGTIYQACGWSCVGRGSSTQQYVSPEGRVMDQKLASNLAKRHRVPRAKAHKWLIDKGWTVQASNPKWRYVKIVREDPALNRLVKSKKVEYPKRRVGSADGGTPARQAGGGGSNPTPTLHQHKGKP